MSTSDSKSKSDNKFNRELIKNKLPDTYTPYNIINSNPNSCYYIEVWKKLDIIDIKPFPLDFMMIGRNKEMDVVVDNESVSRLHAIIFANNNHKIQIIDMESNKGTKLNDVKLKALEPYNIEIGSVLTFAKSSKRYILRKKEENKTENKKEEEPQEHHQQQQQQQQQLLLQEQQEENDNYGHKEDEERQIKLDVINKFRIPLSSSCHLTGNEDHGTATGSAKSTKSILISTISVDKNATRVAVGAMDGTVRLYDFSGMDNRLCAFRTFDPFDGLAIEYLSFSPSGDRIAICCGGSAIKVYDRDGALIIETTKGDMYLRDLVYTKGHTMGVSHLSWHPTLKQTMMSSSVDGSVRLWALNGPTTFQKLVNAYVLRIRSDSGGGHRVAATCALFVSLAKSKQTSSSSMDNGTNTNTDKRELIVAGDVEGSIHIWKHELNVTDYDRISITHARESKSSSAIASADHSFAYPCTRPMRVISPFRLPIQDLNSSSLNTGAITNAVCSLTLCPKGLSLAVRYEDSVALWKLSSILRIASQPIRSSFLYTGHPRAEVAFSPDGQLMCTPIQVTSASTSTSTATTNNQGLSFMKVQTMESQDKNNGNHLVNLFIAQMRFPSLQSGYRPILWPTSINQIICSSSSGAQIFYDQEMSNKGILIGINRSGRSNRDSYISTDVTSVGVIINPHALPMFREDHGYKGIYKGKRKRGINDNKEEDKDKTSTQGPGKRLNTNFFFTEYMAKHHVQNKDLQDDLAKSDPRAALLKYGDLNGQPSAFGLNHNQPKILHNKTMEEEINERDS